MEKIAVVIVAGGSGSRMGGAVPKQFLPLNGKPVLVHTLGRFRAALPGAVIVVVLPEGEIERWSEICRKYGLSGTHAVVAGGANRFESVRGGLSLCADADYILVQDGVRPLVSAELVGRVMETVRRHGTALPAVEPVDSFRMLAETDSRIRSVVVDRSMLRAVQTPQAFTGEILRKAYMLPWSPAFTDDASVVECSGVTITLCEGERGNIKITTPEDLVLAEALMEKDSGSDHS